MNHVKRGNLQQIGWMDILMGKKDVFVRMVTMIQIIMKLFVKNVLFIVKLVSIKQLLHA